MNRKAFFWNTKQVLYSIRRFVLFFLMMSFVITCCMLLFLHNLTIDPDILFSREGIERAAKLTFGNILLLAFICTIIDLVQQKFTIGRPVKRIMQASKKIMQGDFSVRIKPFHEKDSLDGFDEIIECFNAMVNELSSMETLRADFIANVSHELKTPLAVMQNYGMLLQQMDLSEEKRLEYAKAITDASRNLANLITNILKLNKLENQEIYPNTAEYNLSEQLCECLLLFEDAWEQKGLEIETDIEENVMVSADAEMLSLVWNNLFSNAVKFTESGGTISLSVKSEDEFVVVQVADTGCGISKETGAHIFEKFYQGGILRMQQRAMVWD